MKARVIATGEIVDIAEYSTIYAENYDTCFYPNELEFLDNSEDYWTRLEHTYAGMAMQGILGNQTYTKHLLETSTSAKDARDIIVDASMYLAHTLVKKVRYEENPKELEGLKKELEALKIEKTILENKIKLLTEERK